MKIDFTTDELEMINELANSESEHIGNGTYYGDETVDAEYKEIAESIVQKTKEALSKYRRFIY